MTQAVLNYTPIRPSVIADMTIAQLVDELGQVKAEAADIKSREDAIKEALIAAGVTEAEGDLFRATVTEATRWTVDSDRVKTEMGEAWYQARCKIGKTVTVRVSARRGVARKAA